jgi:serine/threonine-protein kinase
MPAGEATLLAGRYRVLHPLGSGGMATVVLCRDERLGREVAVKRLHAHSPEDMERRFAREARLGASLNHPNLVSIFDTAIDDEGVLIVMEYVEGESLSEALRRGPLEPRRAGSMAAELGAALDHAHRQGIVHRDVKPGNVLLRVDGVAKLADLGIATAAGQTRITRSDVVLGTASYMAPEQLDGAEPGPAADVYALAAVCFEALTGSKARSGRTPLEIAHSIATEPPPDLSDHLPGVQPAATELLRKGLARDPRERPGSAGELGAGLREALERPAARTEPTRRVAAPHPRRSSTAPLLVALAAAAVLVAAGAVLVAGGGDDESPPAETRAEEPRTVTERQTVTTPAPEPAPAEEPAVPAPAASGSELNADGFELMQDGRYAEAVPILRRAVAAYPEDSQDIEYAYALFNLGKSLLESGSPDEAIPYLEKRLTFKDQRGTVMRELKRAQREAGA